MSTYLYGVIRRPGRGAKLSAQGLGSGVGDPPSQVSLVDCEEVAAVASDVNADGIGEAAGIRALRRDMIAHTDVLDRILRSRTVLPARFGTFFPDRQTLIDEFLEPEYERLDEQLDRLRRQVEMRLRADFVEAQVLRHLAEKQPQLIAAGGDSYHARIEKGRRIAAAIRDERDREAGRLAEALGAIAHDASTATPASDLAVLRASFLLDRGDLDEFDNLVHELQAQAGPRMRLACIGPLPPYSFVDLRVPARDL